MRLNFLRAILLGIVLTMSARAVSAQIASVVHLVYFYSYSCPHCQAVDADVLKPMEARYGAQFDVKRVEISAPSNYEVLIRAEAKYNVKPEERGIPTLVVGDKILIGEDAIRAQLGGIVERGLAGGIALPDISGLDAIKPDDGTGVSSGCTLTQTVTCATSSPVWIAYFYQTGCQKCSRAESDLQYVHSKQPAMVIDQFNIYDNTALAQWLADRIGRKDIHTPAVFIGSDALIGETEITPQNLEALVQKYSTSGAPRVWADYNPSGGLTEQFRALAPLTVAFAGLVDGLNPCAFATLIFLISYLTFSGRKGREVLAVGGAYTFGVFIAYLTVGVGLYKVLDMLGGLLTTLSRWVYAFTAVMCAILAVMSFLDFLKARRGAIQDMSLKLPPALRKRVNAVVRSSQHIRAFVLGAFITGAIVSMIELACTGQIYLPTIIYVISNPDLRLQALSYLLLYNVMFILPLVVVFGLVYFGTTSFQLGAFLEKNTARVKLAAVVLFASLAAWLGLSLIL